MQRRNWTSRESSTFRHWRPRREPKFLIADGSRLQLMLYSADPLSVSTVTIRIDPQKPASEATVATVMHWPGSSTGVS